MYINLIQYSLSVLCSVFRSKFHIFLSVLIDKVYSFEPYDDHISYVCFGKFSNIISTQM